MTSLLLGSFQEAHRHLLSRAGEQESSVYLGLVFKAYTLHTTSQFALAYFFLIVLGIAERLFSLGIDSIHDKPGQPWRIFPRACIYFVITIIRYVLMIVIMNGYIPMFLVTCLGLTLGQIAVEGIRYVKMMRSIRRRAAAGAQNNADGFNSPKTSGSLADSYEQGPKTTHVSESCC
ncbi:hypothetical protein BX661DRAFT_211352 [Kickxella alabastrina]|uniref:uncharacterized protein n=1 Tax=Kickxella alabastrina TaxID=61397 RepID=UPI002220871B|nr:uncharacterized protein BX661DRAFT_211352 [Kickxella alabastrina]KAI7834618.1 hypothetical protein BX661DRAFT_211352 [Kickxella alabastrina]KAJ1935175.1 hypothetical protein GGF37_006092 [Kickxella alabastrina]